MSTLLNNAAPSAGTKATQVAAIKAILLNSTYLKTATAGDKYVAANELVAYLRAQLVSIATTDSVPSDRQTAVAAMGARAALVPHILPWAGLVSRDNWAQHPQWPAVSELTNAEKTAAFIKTNDSLKAASNRLTDHFEGVKAELVASVPAGYDLAAQSYLPEVTPRTDETRSYIYTYVTDWGWESAPSPPSAVQTVDGNDTVVITATAAPIGRNVTGIRLYRSNSSNTGAAYQFVVENETAVNDAYWTANATTAYTDTKLSAELQEVCPSMEWVEPPTGLIGMKAMPNGVLIGFDDNQIFLSESFVPYAWPVAYRHTTEHKIVGIGVFGQTAVVLTEGFPYYVTGADASVMTAQKMEFPQACISKRTIAAVDGGVLYASPDGLCLASSAGVVNVLQEAVSRKDWQTALGAQANWPAAFAAYHEGIYYIFNSTGTGYAVDLASKMISNLTQVSTGLYSDLLTDKMYVVSGTSLLDLFGGATNNTGVWKSRIFVPPGVPWLNCVRVESAFESTVTLKLYGDGTLVHTATFTSLEPQRLPSGRYREFEIQVEAACPVTRVSLASNMRELAAL